MCLLLLVMAVSHLTYKRYIFPLIAPDEIGKLGTDVYRAPFELLTDHEFLKRCSGGRGPTSGKKKAGQF